LAGDCDVFETPSERQRVCQRPTSHLAAQAGAAVDSHPLRAWAARLSALRHWRNRTAPVILASECASSFAVTYTSLVFARRSASVTHL